MFEVFMHPRTHSQDTDRFAYRGNKVFLYIQPSPYGGDIYETCADDDEVMLNVLGCRLTY